MKRLCVLFLDHMSDLTAAASLLLIVVAIFLTGCGTVGKYIPPPTRFDNLDSLIQGQPTAGTTLAPEDGVTILAAQERWQNLQFERELTDTVGTASSSLTASGIDGAVINESGFKVRFYIIGPMNDVSAAYMVDENLPYERANALRTRYRIPSKNFVVEPHFELATALSPGTYVCYFLDGSREICNPQTFHSNTTQDWYGTRYYNWYVAYYDQ